MFNFIKIVFILVVVVFGSYVYITDGASLLSQEQSDLLRKSAEICNVKSDRAELFNVKSFSYSKCLTVERYRLENGLSPTGYENFSY